MHRITSLETSRNTNLLGYSKTSKLIDLRPTYAKIFFFSERRYDNAILRIKLEYMKEAYCS